MPWLIALIFWMMTTPSAWAGITNTAVPVHSQAGPITVYYTDNGFEQVYLAGSFTDWVRIPLTKVGDAWTITCPVSEGRHFYRFAVMEGGEVWEAIDPNNSTAVNHPDFGWVSVLGVDQDRDRNLNRKSEKKKRIAHRKKIRKELKRNQVLIGELSYQRVDGLDLSFSTTHESPAGTFEPSARLQGSFGLSSGRFGGGLTILQPIFPSHTLNLKLALFDRTMPNSNSTGIGNEENSLAAFIFHEDYFDYHRAKGVNAGLVFKLGNWLRLEGGVRSESHQSLGQRSVWSLKPGDFLPNPAIDEGTLNSVFVNLDLGSRFNHLLAQYERSGEDIFGGDFEFERVSAKLRGRLKLGRDSGFDARVAVGSNFRGTLPTQKRFLLGGLGTVRGYAYQSLLIPDQNQAPVPGQPVFGGQRSVLGNVEYFFQVAPKWGLVLFYDAGMVWQDRKAKPTWGALKTSTGLGINLGHLDNLRIEMIQRLDDRSSPVVFQFRLKRGF